MKRVIVIMAVFFISILKVMAVSETAINFVKENEGFRSKAYWDVSRYSIGYGTSSFKGEEITPEEAEERLKEELIKAEKALVDYFGEKYTSLNDSQKAALLDFRYNVGSLAGCPKLKRAIMEGNLSQVPVEMSDVLVKRSRFSSEEEYQKVLKGLKNRRNAEIKMWNTK